MRPLARLFKDLPIRHKLVAMMFGVTLAALSVGFTLMMADMVASFQRDESTRMAHLGRMVADFSLVPLAFEDPAGAAERLEYLETLPDVVAAQVRRVDGEVFARWLRDGSRPFPNPDDEPRDPRLLSRRFVVVTAIESRDERYGEVVLVATTERLWLNVERSLLVMAGIMTAVLLVSFGFAYRLQKALSQPILELADVTRAVSQRGDYRVRVERDEQDELADLYLGFNTMMERIREREQERDQALEAIARAHDELEQRVVERTAELTLSNRRLSQEIEEREQAQRRLKASLSEKEVLLREIHHRVKNNLQIIYSLLALEAHDKSAAGACDELEDSRQRVKTMALVHETLYRSDDLTGVDAPGFVHQLADDLRSVYLGANGVVGLSVRVDSLELTLDQAIPVGLILNELLTNAFKYAFPEGRAGRVEVELRRRGGDRLELVVSDDGVGLPPGFDWRRAGSLGLQLVAALTGQLHGGIELRPGPGCRFVLGFGYDRPVAGTDPAGLPAASAG